MAGGHHHRLRQLDLTDMDAAAHVHRMAFDSALPWLAGLHTPEEDRWFFRERVFTSCAVWGAFDDVAMTGVIAFRDGWIDQLYVLPTAQGRGVGGDLLLVAQRSFDRLQLWTFQRNDRARRFYEAREFVLIRTTDGVDNEEKEPDALYHWTRSYRRMSARAHIRTRRAVVSDRAAGSSRADLRP